MVNCSHLQEMKKPSKLGKYRHRHLVDSTNSSVEDVLGYTITSRVIRRKDYSFAIADKKVLLTNGRHKPAIFHRSSLQPIESIPLQKIWGSQKPLKFGNLFKYHKTLTPRALQHLLHCLKLGIGFFCFKKYCSF